MKKHHIENQTSPEWRNGAPVKRKDSENSGTIVEANGTIKVRWDNGQTSYYRRDVPGNVRLKDAN